jgi:hypothetical protein
VVTSPAVLVSHSVAPMEGSSSLPPARLLTTVPLTRTTLRLSFGQPLYSQGIVSEAAMGSAPRSDAPQWFDTLLARRTVNGTLSETSSPS